MLFNTIECFIFVFIVLITYWSIPKKYQNILLLVASYVFYGWWDYRFCSLLLISTIVDYSCGIGLSKSDNLIHRKLILTVSLLVNLGLLCFFKYFNFFVDSAENLLHTIGMNADYPTLKIVMPVGISFYTFQTLSYTIDTYFGKQKPTKNLINFAVFVAYFPQLVAGPIERSRRLLPQIENTKKISQQQLKEGIELIIIGLVKKVVIADVVASHVTSIFSNPSIFSSTELLLGIYLFSIQIYCDFSGYSSIARGISKLLGIELVQNFWHPYFSASFKEFWQRWHISLSQWLRDYVYIPLGGNRKGECRTYLNLLFTMLIGGLWHGANWTFVFWGFLHATYLIIERILNKLLHPVSIDHSNIILKFLKGIVIFHLVAFAWIFFRAPSLHAACKYISGFFVGSNVFNLGLTTTVVFAIVTMLLVDLPQRFYNSQLCISKFHPVFRGITYAITTVLIILTWDRDYTPFIYFQF